MSARQRGRRRLLVAIVTALVVVVVFVLGFVTPGWFVTRVFDAGAVQTGVAKVLADDYATDGVADVRCPQNVQVTAGATFTCDATIDGDPVTIPITVTDDRGRLPGGAARLSGHPVRALGDGELRAANDLFGGSLLQRAGRRRAVGPPARVVHAGAHVRGVRPGRPAASAPRRPTRRAPRCRAARCCRWRR